MSGDQQDPAAEPRTAADMPLPGGDFTLFITRLNIHGLMSLGLMQNPLTGESHVNLDQARMLVLDLEMLQAKTVGNLTEFETSQLNKVASDLRHAYEQRATPDANE